MSTVKNVLINVKSNTKGIKDLQTEFDKLTADNKQLAKQYKKTNDALSKTMQKGKTEAKSMGDVFNNLGLAISGAFAVAQVIGFGKHVFNITAEFQKLEAVLTNTLGSKSEAQLALAQIKKFASETPFSVVELTDSFVKLSNQGFKPTVEEMRKLGDLASSTGKNFDMLAEAIIDGQVGEFERLKEFGIRASKQGDKVAFTFKGVTTEVDRTEQAMRNYIVALGDVEGVSGASAAIAATLTGQVSMLGDAFDSLGVAVGSGTDGVFSGVINGLTETVKLAERLTLGYDGLAKQQKLVFGAEITNEIIGRVDNLVKNGGDYNAIVDTQIANLERQKTLEENEIIRSKERVNSSTDLTTAVKEGVKGLATMGVTSTAYVGELLLQAETERTLQAERTGNIQAIDELIIRLKEETDITSELNKAKADKAAKEADEQRLKNAKEYAKALEEQNKKQKKLDERLQKLALSTGQADLAFARFLTSEKELTEETELATLALMQEEDAVLDLGKAFDDLGIKTQEQIDMQNFMVSSAIEGFALTANTAVQLYQQQLDKQANAEMSFLEKKLARGQISDDEFERRRKAIARKQFEQGKEAAILQINIAGAVASANVWAEHAGNPQVALVLQGLVLAETAAQLALVANQPIPEFEKGGEIGGKRHKHGGTPIIAEKGEFMINRISYGKNKDAVNAINDGKFDKYVYDQYVLPAMKLGSIHSHDNKDLAENIAKSILMQSKLDDQRIVGHLKMNNDTSIDNTVALINALGKGRKDMRNV